MQVHQIEADVAQLLQVAVFVGYAQAVRVDLHVLESVIFREGNEFESKGLTVGSPPESCSGYGPPADTIPSSKPANVPKSMSEPESGPALAKQMGQPMLHR